MDKNEVYKKKLKTVNMNIRNNHLIDPYIEFKIKEDINLDTNLSINEKKYLINKIEAFRYEYLKGLGNGNFNLFKISKKIITFENIYFLGCYSKINKKGKDISRIDHLLNSGVLKEEEKQRGLYNISN
ncbi:MAG: hypothetical protein RSB41_03685 [Bacilli bacterium]